MLADVGLHPIKSIAAPEHPTPESSLANEHESARTPFEADEAAPRVKPQLPPHLRGTFSPGCTRSGSVPVAARFDALPAPEPQTNKDVVRPHQAAADAALTIQVGLPNPNHHNLTARGLAMLCCKGHVEVLVMTCSALWRIQKVFKGWVHDLDGTC